MNNLHAATATTGGGLDDHRETDFLGNLDSFLNGLHPFLGTRQNRDTLLDDRLTGTDLIAHDPHTLRRSDR